MGRFFYSISLKYAEKMFYTSRRLPYHYGYNFPVLIRLKRPEIYLGSFYLFIAVGADNADSLLGAMFCHNQRFFKDFLNIGDE